MFKVKSIGTGRQLHRPNHLLYTRITTKPVCRVFAVSLCGLQAPNQHWADEITIHQILTVPYFPISKHLNGFALAIATPCQILPAVFKSFVCARPYWYVNSTDESDQKITNFTSILFFVYPLWSLRAIMIHHTTF